MAAYVAAYRIGIAKQGARNRWTGFGTWEPSLEERAYFGRHRSQHQRASTEQDEDDRLARCSHSFQQFLLIPGKIQVDARPRLAARRGIFSERHHRKVRPAGGIYRFGKPGFGISPNFRSFGIHQLESVLFGALGQC